MNEGFLLGLDIGSSSVKASLVQVATGKEVASALAPDIEMPILARRAGWAEQYPAMWWQHVVSSTQLCLRSARVSPHAVLAIGIAYQMHGLVAVDKERKVLRPAIIWCDSRAVAIGERAFKDLGEDYCLQHLLNNPGNFTASRLRWVCENEPQIFDKIHKAMLPGDFIAMKLTGEIKTTDTGLSEGMFWDFQERGISKKLLNYFKISEDLLPAITPVFSVQGELQPEAARELGLLPGTKISYRAGDQPNNAFSLNALNPGETAATAGTSGVIYSVTDRAAYDARSRVNSFIHVTNGAEMRNGILLCINGTGILYSWLRNNVRSRNSEFDYYELNDIAAEAPIGSDGLVVLPFGNGAERVLENKEIGASFHGLNFNQHGRAHLLRASQEGIAFSLKYGLDVLETIGSPTKVIRAGIGNLFLSPLFCEAFVNTTGTHLELYKTNGAQGAALGAGVGAGIYSFSEAFRGLALLRSFEPVAGKTDVYTEAYEKWKQRLAFYMANS